MLERGQIAAQHIADDVLFIKISTDEVLVNFKIYIYIDNTVNLWYYIHEEVDRRCLTRNAA